MKTYLLGILPALLLSCNNAYDAEKAAAGYCECLLRNGGKNDFDKVGPICDAKLITENRYYKLFAVDMRNDKLDIKLSNTTRDSVKQFMMSFEQYVNSHCCEYMFGCPKSNRDSR